MKLKIFGILSIFLVLILAVGFGTALDAAAQAPEPSFKMTSVTLLNNDEFVLNLYGENLSGFESGLIVVSYDMDIFEYLGKTDAPNAAYPAKLFVQIDKMTEFSLENGKKGVSCLYSSEESFTSNDPILLAQLKFRIDRSKINAQTQFDFELYPENICFNGVLIENDDISLTDSVVELATFSAETDFTFTKRDNAYYVTGYNGASVNVSLPATHEGLLVKGIDDGAFSGKPIVNLLLPLGLDSIALNAFNNCTALESISFNGTGNSEKYTSLNDGALYYINRNIPEVPVYSLLFYPLANKSQIFFANIIKEIPANIFNGVSALENIFVSASVETINFDSFNGAPNIKSFTVDSLNANYSSHEGVIYSKAKDTLLFYPAAKKDTVLNLPAATNSITASELIINDKLAAINVPAESISFASLDGVLFNKGATTLRYYPPAKAGTSYEIPSSATSIIAPGFLYNDKLTSITLHKDITFIDEHAIGYLSVGGLPVKQDSIVFKCYEDSYADEELIGAGFTNILYRPEIEINTYPASIYDQTDFVFSYDLKDFAFASPALTGNGISVDDYTIENGTITIKKEFIARLALGENTFKVFFTDPSSIDVIIDVNNNCEHNYSTIRTLEPTCNSTGTDTRTCAYCGDIQLDVIPKSEIHGNLSEVTTITADCKIEGSKFMKCDICQQQIGETITVPKLTTHGSALTTVTTQPTCTALGQETDNCSICNAVLAQRPVSMKPHTYLRTVTLEPTCVLEGESFDICSVCQYKNTESLELIAKIAHVYENVTLSAATCTAEGSKADKCTTCGEEINLTAIPKVAHKEGTWTQSKAPTCMAVGTQTTKCTVCNQTLTKDIAIDKNAHGTFVSQVIKKPTATKTGESAMVCSNGCGTMKNKKTIPPTGNVTNPTNPTGTTNNNEPTTQGGDDYAMGDVNNDGVITAVDARLILRNSAMLETFDEKQLKAAEVDGDGTITAIDARITLRVSASLQEFRKPE